MANLFARFGIAIGFYARLLQQVRWSSAANEPAVLLDLSQQGQDSQDEDAAPALAADPAPPASLLGLPSELRNSIWRYVLLEADEIKLQPGSDATQPGLLRVNRQIRSETCSIYARENAFAVVVQDLQFAPHKGHWVWNQGDGEGEGLLLEGRLSWTNLLEWVFAHWKGEATGLQYLSRKASADEEASAWEKAGAKIVLVNEAFRVADDLRRQNVSWEVVARTLEAMKRVATRGKDATWTD